MFLLFRKAPTTRLFHELIYIPICFYYFDFIFLAVDNYNLIYIPICFYYFRGRLTLRTVTRFNLHSNMFLLFLLPVLVRCKKSIIYIPICFYYFKTGALLSWNFEIIYIPICFYYFRLSIPQSHLTI